MRVCRNGALVGAVASLALAATLALAPAAGAQTAPKPAHRHIHAPTPKTLPLAPGVDLDASTSAAIGSENHYFSDTVGSSYIDLTDQSFRYGQSPSPHFDASEPLFRF
jgi:hypothetical protein